MQFEWDENKRKSNIEKHGIDFVDAVKIFDGFTHDTQDTRQDWGEERFVSVGLLAGVEISVVNTPRNGRLRIISARRARKEERKRYYEEVEKIGNGLGKTSIDEG